MAGCQQSVQSMGVTGCPSGMLLGSGLVRALGTPVLWSNIAQAQHARAVDKSTPCHLRVSIFGLRFSAETVFEWSPACAMIRRPVYRNQVTHPSIGAFGATGAGALQIGTPRA